MQFRVVVVSEMPTADAGILKSPCEREGTRLSVRPIAAAHETGMRGVAYGIPEHRRDSNGP